MKLNTNTTSGRLALVTGGSGFVGGHLINRLISAGWRVRGIGRSTESLEAIAQIGAEPFEADLSGGPTLKNAMEGVDTVFHVAAHFRLWGPESLFREINVEGTRHVVEAALQAGARRVVYVSAAAVVMGKPEPQLNVTEDWPLQQMDFAPYSSSKAEAEAIVLAANGARSGFSTIAIRPPFIWGPNMHVLDTIVRATRAGQFRWIDGGGQVLSTCHVDNLCHALVLAADKGSGGAAYFVTDGEETTLKIFLTRLLNTRDISPSSSSVPFQVAWAMAGLLGRSWHLLKLRGEPPMTRQMLRLMGKDFTLDTSRAQNELGYAPVLSPEDGYRQMR